MFQEYINRSFHLCVVVVSRRIIFIGSKATAQFGSDARIDTELVRLVTEHGRADANSEIRNK